MTHKLKGATIIETIIATVIVLAVFIIASLILNQLFKKSLQDDVLMLNNETQKMHYMFNNGMFDLPYSDDYNDYEIIINLENVNDIKYVRYEFFDQGGESVFIKFFVKDE